MILKKSKKLKKKLKQKKLSKIIRSKKNEIKFNKILAGGTKSKGKPKQKKVRKYKGVMTYRNPFLSRGMIKIGLPSSIAKSKVINRILKKSKQTRLEMKKITGEKPNIESFGLKRNNRGVYNLIKYGRQYNGTLKFKGPLNNINV